MGHLIIADGHYTNAPHERARWEQLLHQASAAGVRELSILGDFFELWVALPGAMPSWQQAFVDALRPLQQQGVKVRYVMGNKDYYIAQWNRHAAVFAEVVEVATTIASPVGPVHLEHGDLVNQADRAYQRWRRFSRSRPLHLLGRLLPRWAMRPLANGLARWLKGTNRVHKSYFPEMALRQRARAMPPGPLTLMFGHFHSHKVLQEGDKRIITLPFLATDNAGLWIDRRGISLFPAA